MDKLLPCPFCGLPPYTIEQTRIIICQTPDCPKVEALTPEEWNRRAPGEAPAPTPDELTFEDAPTRNIVGTVKARFREVPPAPPEALDLDAMEREMHRLSLLPMAYGAALIAECRRLRSLPPSAPASPPPGAQETRDGLRTEAEDAAHLAQLQGIERAAQAVIKHFGKNPDSMTGDLFEALEDLQDALDATPDPREGAGEGRQG